MELVSSLAVARHIFPGSRPGELDKDPHSQARAALNQGVDLCPGNGKAVTFLRGPPCASLKSAKQSALITP